MSEILILKQNLNNESSSMSCNSFESITNEMYIKFKASSEQSIAKPLTTHKKENISRLVMD